MYPKIPQPVLRNPRIAYLINNDARDKMGRFLPLMAVEFEEGYIVVDGALSPGFQISQKIVDLKNSSLGLSKAEANKIIASTKLKFICLN